MFQNQYLGKLRQLGRLGILRWNDETRKGQVYKYYVFEVGCSIWLHPLDG